MNKINLKGVDKSTWIRSAVLIIALVNQGLVIFGKSHKNIDIDSLNYNLSYFFTIISSVWAWWKNNSFTEKAQQADIIKYQENGAKG